MNSEGKMFYDICRRYDCSGSFLVGNANFNLETIKVHARSESHKQNQLRFDATRKPEILWMLTKILTKLNQTTIHQLKILFRSTHDLERETDLSYKVVLQASKFQKSLAWWPLIQLIRCRTPGSDISTHPLTQASV